MAAAFRSPLLQEHSLYREVNPSRRNLITDESSVQGLFHKIDGAQRWIGSELLHCVLSNCKPILICMHLLPAGLEWEVQTGGAPLGSFPTLPPQSLGSLSPTSNDNYRKFWSSGPESDIHKYWNFLCIHQQNIWTSALILGNHFK